MAAGLPDLVDCARLAEEEAVLHREYELEALARLRDMLAEPRGTLQASFAFAKSASGRPGVQVKIETLAQLLCQRCLQGFGCRVNAASELEFAAAESADPDTERELYLAPNGRVSLKDLAEEELLLALPMAPACDAPLTCGNAPGYVTDERGARPAVGTRRPFSGLKDLLKKT